MLIIIIIKKTAQVVSFIGLFVVFFLVIDCYLACMPLLQQ